MLAKRREKAEKKAQELAKTERANARRRVQDRKMTDEFIALENAREAKAARQAAKEGIAPKEVKPSGLIKTIKRVKPPPLPDTGRLGFTPPTTGLQ